MLGSAQPSTLYAAATTSTPTPASPTRPSRLRGLSYLRSYTHNHLHPSRSEAPTLARSTSSPGAASPTTAAPTPHHQQQQPTSPERGSQSAIQNAEGGWIPSIHGRSGLIRESAQPTTTSTAASPEPANSSSIMMTRSRTAGSSLGPTPTAVHPAQRRQPAFDNTPTTDPFGMPEPSSNASAGTSKDQLPSIRFIPHVETRSSRPSLQFTALSRTLKDTAAVVRVGRYSERDHHTGDANTLPVGFKSKVVSRRHCEFWCTEGQWYIKDVKSSSGTFLNHVRLSSPGVESRPYPVNDGDVVQLGIDFKGGEEVIFRCVKIRVECNRGWQKSLNSFNTAAHKRLFKSALKTKNRDSDAGSVNSSECSICLNPVAPCQALFVAPCSHVWHYKCVRNLIHGPQWPNFVCPNCRFVADLEADVEQPEEEDYVDEEETQRAQQLDTRVENGLSDGQSSPSEEEDQSETPRQNRSRNGETDEDLAELLNDTSLESTSPDVPAGGPADSATLGPSSVSRPIQINQPSSASRTPSDPLGARSMTPTSHAPFALAIGPIAEGPTTPRNDAGPFLLDGNSRGNRADNSLVTQPVPEVSEPGSMEEQQSRTTT